MLERNVHHLGPNDSSVHSKEVEPRVNFEMPRHRGLPKWKLAKYIIIIRFILLSLAGAGSIDFTKVQGYLEDVYSTPIRSCSIFHIPLSFQC